MNYNQKPLGYIDTGSPEVNQLVKNAFKTAEALTRARVVEAAPAKCKELAKELAALNSAIFAAYEANRGTPVGNYLKDLHAQFQPAYLRFIE